MDAQERVPELGGVARASHQEFHAYLAEKISAGKAKKPNVVLTDPPYFIGLADWDEQRSEDSIDLSFTEYLLSANSVMSDDGMFIIFNTKENVERLATLVKTLSSDEDHPEFDYVVMDHHEWIKSNPNRKTDAHYAERSEYLMLAYRNTLAGKDRFSKIQPHYQFGKDNEFFESAALTKPYDELSGKGKINQTPKPPRMIKTAMQRLTLPDDVILDSFAGSASIAIAGYELGRTVYSCELSRYTQIKATNRLQRFKQRIGQRVLRCEPFTDMTDFDVDDDDLDLIRHYFDNRVEQLPQSFRATYVNAKLVDMLERYREKYAEAQGNNSRSVENAEISTKLNNDFLTNEDRAMILGLSKYWGTKEFENLFGFDSRSQPLIEKSFDPVALNYVLRYRYNFMLQRHASYWANYLKKGSELGNNKKRPTPAQVVDYELYLLQLLNGLTFYEGEIQAVQDDMAHESSDTNFNLHDERSEKVYSFYRITAILVCVLDSLNDYFFGLDGDKNTNMDLTEHIINREMFNSEEDIAMITGEFRFIHQLAVTARKDVFAAGKMKEQHREYLTDDTGNHAKEEALLDGYHYFREFIGPKLKRGSIFEVPALMPINVGKSLNLQKLELLKYQLYALSASVPVTGKGYIKWGKVRGEFVRKSFDGRPKNEEEKYLVKTVKELLNQGLSVIEVSKMLMVTQGTINNLRKKHL